MQTAFAKASTLMKTHFLTRALPALCLLISLVPARADVLIDGFVDAAGPLSTGGTTFVEGSVYLQDDDPVQIYPAQRVLQLQAGGGFGGYVDIYGDTLIVNGGPDSGSTGYTSFTAVYDGFNFDLGDNYYFQFTTEQVTGSPLLVIELSSGVTSETVTGDIQLSPSENGIFTIDISQLSNFSPSFVSQFNGLTITMYSNEAFSVAGESFAFSSTVPEPSTALLLTAGMAFFTLRRRQSGRQLAVISKS
jgi:hypothetical protein